MISSRFQFTTLSLALLLAACNSTMNPAKQAAEMQFKEVSTFLNNEPNLRKWDTPVVADIDQDGFPDLLLNDHGFSVKIIWNNKGEFATPYDLIVGDMHGISIDDIDHDGKVEIIIARGGGSGSNARNSVIFKVDKNRKIEKMDDYKEPLAMMRGRTVKFLDFDKDGNTDLLNFAFPSKEMQGQSENYVYQNTGAPNYQLVLKNTLPASFQDGQKLLLSDYNNDGYVDIFMYGNKALKLYKGAKDFSFELVTEMVLPANIEHVTGAVELDFDNDGDMDIYLARGREFKRGQTFHNAQTNTFGFYTKRGKFDFELQGVGDVLVIENMQSQWPNKDVYIGESGYDYEFPGETHSGRNVRLINSDSLGFPQTLDKKGTYIGYIGNGNWRIAGDIWSPFSGIIHNVKEYQPSVKEVGLIDVLLENIDGQFVDKTKSLGLDVPMHIMGVATGDIDNDGFQDLVLMPRGTMVETNQVLVFKNNNGQGFTQLPDHGIASKELGAIGLGIDLLDYDLDGKLDVLVGSDRGRWRLFKNTENNNPSIQIKVGRSPQHEASALGAKVELTSCGNKQTKRLGNNGAAYSYSADNYMHFGLNSCQETKQVNVTWGNGEYLSRNIEASDTLVSLGNF